jgi:hypothetical protein
VVACILLQPGTMLPRASLLVLGVASTMLCACGEQYCQRGAKYGGQCYTINEVEWQETQVRAEPPPERSIEPAPGCELLTPDGVYVVPKPGPGGWSTTARRPRLYVMSGACVSRRQPAYGAIR